MEEEKDLSVVELAKKRYEAGKTYYSKFRSEAKEDLRFYLGDSENGWQWPNNITMQRGQIEKRPCLTINITAQHVNQIVNQIRESRPTGKVLPVDDYADKKTAEIIEGIIRNIQSCSNADDVHDLAAELAVAGGDGYWRITTDYISPDSFDQEIKITMIPDSASVILDPNTKEIDRSDADWAFVFEDLPKSEVEKRWPKAQVSSWDTGGRDGWVQDDTVRVADYYCVYYEDDVLQQLPDGSAEYQSNIPQSVIDELKARNMKTRPVKRRKIKIHKLVGQEQEPVETWDWVGTIIPICSVIGKEIIVAGEMVRKGLVRDLKDAARMVNYSYSAAVETIALQNKIPYIAPAAAIEGYEQFWEGANNNNYAYLPFNHVDELGNPIPRPERQQPAVMPAAQIQMLQVSVEQMRAASGQQNANFGIKSEAASGVGIQRLKVQGDIATFHFQDQLYRALKYEIRVLLELICSGKIYDTRRVMRVMGIDGSTSQAVVDPNFDMAHQEITQGDIKAIFNPTIGTYDVSIDIGPSFATKRQEGSQQMTEILSRNPQLMQVIGDLAFRAMDFPYSDKIADRLQKMLPPQLQEQKGQQLPPQVLNDINMAHQHIQQQDQIIQQMQAELQSKQSDAETAQLKAQIEAKRLELEGFRAETERARLSMEGDNAEQLKHALEQMRMQVQQETDLYKAHLEAEVKLMLGELASKTTLTAAQMKAADNVVDGEQREFETGQQESGM